MDEFVGSSNVVIHLTRESRVGSNKAHKQKTRS
jgi:hypothetical protein